MEPLEDAIARLTAASQSIKGLAGDLTDTLCHIARELGAHGITGSVPMSGARGILCLEKRRDKWVFEVRKYPADLKTQILLENGSLPLRLAAVDALPALVQELARAGEGRADGMLPAVKLGRVYLEMLKTAGSSS